MGFDIEEMRAKILLAADPNSGYTMKDFNEEFNSLVGDLLKMASTLAIRNEQKKNK